MPTCSSAFCSAYVIDTHYDGTICPDPISMFINVRIFFTYVIISMSESRVQHSATLKLLPGGACVFVALEFVLGCVYMAGDGHH